MDFKMTTNDPFAYLIDFLTGDTAYTVEFQCFFMALQGAMAIRNGRNRDGQLPWFKSFVLSVLAGYGGGWFGFVWLGLPTSMFSNDLSMASCILAFIIVNYTPFDIGYKISGSLPVVFLTVVWAQLFRSLGVVNFCDKCFDTFKDRPSAYYPIPVFGPIMYATLLGNMGNLVVRGLEDYLANGMPWGFQNGIFIASWYHFFVHDMTGPIGTAFRTFFPIDEILGLENHRCGRAMVGLFMQIMGILQMPAMYGPKFSPFDSVRELVIPSESPARPTLTKGSNTQKVAAVSNNKSLAKGSITAKAAPAPAPKAAPEAAASAPEHDATSTAEEPTNGGTKKKKKKRNRKKNAKKED